MGCNCKRANKAHDMLVGEEKTSILSGIVQRFIPATLLLIGGVIATPIMLVMMFFTYLFGGSKNLKLPQIISNKL